MIYNFRQIFKAFFTLTVCAVILDRMTDAMAQAIPSKDEPNSKWETVINSLANLNPPPKLVKLGFAREPFFTPDYDWKEQQRVRRTFAGLAREENPELWEQLLKHIIDKRYAITMRDNGPNARNYSVGDLCRLIASERIFFASAWHSDPDSRDRYNVWLDVGIDDIAKWRADRPKKSLYELQIEICERSIEEVDKAKDKDVPAKAKSHIRGKLKGTIDDLRKTKRPLFFRPLMGGFEYFDADQAKRLREKIDQNQ